MKNTFLNKLKEIKCTTINKFISVFRLLVIFLKKLLYMQLLVVEKITTNKHLANLLIIIISISIGLTGFFYSWTTAIKLIVCEVLFCASQVLLLFCLSNSLKA